MKKQPLGHPVLLATLALAASALSPSLALAQCDAGDAGDIDPSLAGTLRGTFPSDMARNVPTDGIVRLRYFIRAPSPPTVCVRLAANLECLPGRAAIFNDEIVWQGDERPGLDPLDPNADYVVTYSETTGGTNRFIFHTGRVRSSAAPDFGGINNATARDASGDPCDSNSVDITVRFTRVAAPLWPDSDIEYVTYLTRGPTVRGPREVDRARLQSSGSSVDRNAQRTFRLSGRDGSGPVCFNIQAVDPLGRSNGNTVEQCVNPALGNNFTGCSTAPATPRLAPFGAAFLFALGITLRRRRPHRAASRGETRA